MKCITNKCRTANKQFDEMAGRSASYEIFYVYLQWLPSPTGCGTTPPFRQAAGTLAAIPSFTLSK